MTQIAIMPQLPQNMPAQASPLSLEQYDEIEQAHLRSKRVRRAIVVAAIDAWTSAIFAGGSMLLSLFSPISFIVGVGFCLIAFDSFVGLRLLKKFDLRGPRVLAVNQLLLAALVTAYSIYSIYSIWDAIHNPGKATDPLMDDPQVKAMLGDMQPMLLKLTIAVYGIVIVGTLVMQGLTAWYYETRTKHLAVYLNETPAWVLELQKKQAGP